jgi:hypothetical protein
MRSLARGLDRVEVALATALRISGPITVPITLAMSVSGVAVKSKERTQPSPEGSTRSVQR